MDISPLQLKCKNLTEDPGVYLMKDAAGQIIYVGKARNLKARVSSYFQDSKDKAPRTELMVRRVENFEVVITDNEVEALILECNLIKKHKPRFNVLLKDDKTFPYVRIDPGTDFPRLEYTRRVKRGDGARYFGPYVSPYQIRDLLRWAQKTFQLRDCSDPEFRNRARPCILHQMQQCSAPCVGLISVDAYDANVKKVLKILDGKTDEVVGELTKEMRAASESEEFELAGELRDRIRQILELNEEQKISDPESMKDRDVINFARGTIEKGTANRAVIVVMVVRDGRAVGVFQFPFDSVEASIPDQELLFGFLSQYYLKRYEDTPQLMPKEVLVPMEFEDEAVLERALAKTVTFRMPKRGEAADLVAMVHKTAAHHLESLVDKAAHAQEDLMDVQKKLDLKRFPVRVECYDISHFQGEGTVASRVVFIDGRPEKKLYRHYHVKTVEGVDDFKSMREILGRRFEGDPQMPDLVVIDGGKGQLAQAEAIFEELGVVGVELVSLAKARTERDFTEEEVRGSMERVFKPGQKNPIMLKPGTGVYRVLTQVRNEAHRFAIEFHRRVRDKRSIHGRKSR